MTVSSMTGFGRAECEFNNLTWSWEVKSVNNKSLDVRVRLPSGYDRLELAVRREAQHRFKRGSLNVSLTVGQSQITEVQHKFHINQTLLHQLVETAQKINPCELVNIEALLNVRGVVEKLEEPEGEEEKEARTAKMMESLVKALDSLKHNRIAEGKKLAKVLQQQLQGISDCIDATEIILVRRGQDKNERLQVQLSEILKVQPPLSEERLLQELALITIKSDITEELDRLRSHVSASKQLLKDSEPKGRRLDFLCQEFNREANTIRSKANDIELTKHGLEMKALIEQFREQVQNVE